MIVCSRVYLDIRRSRWPLQRYFYIVLNMLSFQHATHGLYSYNSFPCFGISCVKDYEVIQNVNVVDSVVNKSLSLALREGISNETTDNIANET